MTHYEKRRPIFKRVRIFCLCLLSLTIGGCISTVQHHGALIQKEQLAKVQVGKSTQRDVQSILGTPSCVPLFENNQVWYYVSRSTENVMFFDPKLLDSHVYVLTFSPQGVLEKMEKIDNQKVTEVLPVDRVTPSVGHETPVMKKLFRNLGKNPEGPSAPKGL